MSKLLNESITRNYTPEQQIEYCLEQIDKLETRIDKISGIITRMSVSNEEIENYLFLKFFTK